jgi:hypothetical protein
MMDMQKTTGSTESTWQPAPPESDEDDLTQPCRIISSRTPHSGVPFKPRGSWFKKYEQPGVRRTPDYTEIGDPAVPAA